ncbi:hypothetical protein KUTeg_003979 [Tegillarca granosa]|uniref:Uncharacterized protein n=1 Tax=Tegillarca granosa TaxID=220873 RepID=A0ABQ9FNN3_TEGGR|nr:hypothetical protein KUTeg_003979 [Tegillarca granosa]
MQENQNLIGIWGCAYSMNKFYDRKPAGLNGALQDLGIEFQGREHSASRGLTPYKLQIIF